ncbi:4-(cytidine 5'-diphospho)-2-C-methyl-D-erythritol kinase [Helicobacter mesocricetorum]|uniref:4-(cytidine 5'-diphospho)-2-C-methyl-D-erythritol kinase n=1 Tax=Helicobacter mesocricetorum TaxID=87012 RepID=UPI000CF13921|nr:4-(cytidine 5'-diphospho)-2-C-methyl-D-erythritol kinase [Helicobacter mesocricetorum]
MIKSFAKINIFLKITGKMLYRGQAYHTISSRFMLYRDLYDEMEISFNSEEFQILGNFDCSLEKNTIYQAYKEILPFLNQEQKEAISHLKINVHKKIPSGGGLGGGSSNAAIFLQWVNDFCGLALNNEKLCEIGSKVGSDVPFFVSGFEMANVSGRGEIVEFYDEEALKVEIINPHIPTNTARIYEEYSKNFYKPTQENWLNLENQKILEKSALEANDLLAPLLKIHPNLNHWVKEGGFLSGSGSCFWRVV